MPHICVSKLAIISSDNGLSPGRRHYLNQWWNIVNSKLRNKLQWNLKRNSYIFIKKMHLKMSSGKSLPFCLGLNVLTHWGRVTHICVGTPTKTPSHYLNQWWNIVNLNLRNKLKWNISLNSNIFIKLHLKKSSGKWQAFCLGLNVSKNTYIHVTGKCHEM